MAMASSEEDMEEFINCSICLEVFTDPKILDCLHTFCEPCLRKMPITRRQSLICCPTCRELTPLPARGGTKSLKSDFKTNKLIDRENKKKKYQQEEIVKCSLCREQAKFVCFICELLFCSACEGKHQNGQNAHNVEEGHTLFEFKSDMMCTVHPWNLLVKYCHQCEKEMCKSCALTCSNTHKCMHISNYEKYCSMLKSELRDPTWEKNCKEKREARIKSVVKGAEQLKQSFEEYSNIVSSTLTRQIQALNNEYKEKVKQVMENQISSELNLKLPFEEVAKHENFEHRVAIAMLESPMYLMKSFKELMEDIKSWKDSMPYVLPCDNPPSRKLLSDFMSLLSAYKEFIDNVGADISSTLIDLSVKFCKSLREDEEILAPSFKKRKLCGNFQPLPSTSRCGGDHFELTLPSSSTSPTLPPAKDTTTRPTKRESDDDNPPHGL